MAYRFNPFTSQLDFYQEDTQFVSSGGIANLTSGQQDLIREGSIVTTTDGRRWAYSGTGSKTLEASYVELADITPEWSVIANKPAIPTAAPAAGQIMAGNAGGTAFATVSVSGDATLAATGALTIANNAVTNAKLAAAATATLKGRTAPGAGDVSDLTASDVRALLNVADGAEANVQANWTESNSALDSFIQNKPTLGGAALLNVGTTTGTVAAGDDARLSDSRTPTSHTHAAADITSGTIDIARIPTGTGSTQVALGDHTHTQLHDRSHAMTGTSDHTAGNWQVFYSNGSGQVTELPLGSNGTVLTSSGTSSAPSFTAVAGVTTGSVDNAILRADGTGGSTLQNSGITIEDATTSTQRNVQIYNNHPAATSFAITASASTDTVTATGHTFVNDDVVCFTSLTGGSGLSLEPVSYYVRNAATNTFQLGNRPSIFGGAVVDILNDYTSGSVQLADSSIVLTSKGRGALIWGSRPDGTIIGGNARGENAIDLQTRRGAASQVASNRNAIVIGTNSTASGAESVCIGSDGVASGQGSVVLGGQRGGGSSALQTGSLAIGGFGHSANAAYASCLGGQYNTTNANYSATVGGTRALSNRYAMVSHAAGSFAADGDAQRARFVLRCKTTTNSAVEMALDGGTTYLSIPNNKVIFMNIKIVGARSTGAEIATYERQYAVKNVALTSSQVYAPVTIGTDNAAGTVLDLSVVDAAGSGTDYVSIKVTGIASQTWRWVASVDAVEVELGT